ncbi:MAG: hypothetical protein WDN24_15065 [Sphingomonas sp.]
MKRALAALALLLAPFPAAAQKIDRHALVTRHNVTLTQVDPHAPVMLGNGKSRLHRRHHGIADLSRAYIRRSRRC